ncbi:predicted GPI-anchored protein 58 [Cryptomeria japonica]|uniref:predicted GPI-anchored protein 58 n=1 Tax=Cryptomeria japonica TaxID=3369 RepID=UPI0027DA287E|nr:predicted GPI-anchored protein 58 [Cryptomeria japonica]
MASAIEKTIPITSQEAPQSGTSSTQPQITHAISFAPPQQREVAKPKRKRSVKNATVVSSDSEHFVEPHPSPEAIKPIPKRRRASPKKPSAQSSTPASPIAKKPQEEGSNPQEEAPKPKRRRAPTKKSTPSASAKSGQTAEVEPMPPTSENPSEAQQKQTEEAPSSFVPAKTLEEIAKELAEKLEAKE